MSHIASIVRKEVKELLTVGSVLSVLVMVVLFAGLGGLIGSEVEKAQEFPRFGLVCPEDTQVTDSEGNVWDLRTSLEAYYSSAGADPSEYIVDMNGVPQDGLVSAMEEAGVNSLIVVADDFAERIAAGEQASISEYYIYEATGMFGTVSSTVISTVVGLLNTSLSMFLISDTADGDYAFLTNPISYGDDNITTIIDGEMHTGVTPGAIAQQMMSQTMMVPIIIMIIIMMIGSIVISSMGSEKENKTLETLLTLPIKRTTIVTGKIVAASIVGLISGLAYMVGMSIYMGAFTGPMGTGVDLKALGMALEPVDYVLLMLSMFMAIICALGICMILGAFAKNYKSAQTMTMPLSLMAMVPMFVIMFTGWYGSGTLIQVITFLIPFSHPMMAMQSLMYGDYTLVLAGIAYMAVFAAAAIFVTVKLYCSDILITGLGQNSLVQKLTRSR